MALCREGRRVLEKGEEEREEEMTSQRGLTDQW